MREKRVFIAGIHLESNSFTPLPSRYADFALYRGEALRRRLAGADVLKAAGCDVIPGLFATAVPGGELLFDDYQRMADEILNALRVAGDVDGVLLVLHGAMAVRDLGSGEADLAGRVREIVGAKTPIAAALDLHANNVPALAEAVNIITGYRTAPHIDEDETRRRAARLLLDAMARGALPQARLIRLPMILPGEMAMTDYDPAREIEAQTLALESYPGIWSACWFVGMAWTDSPQTGGSLTVSGVDGAPYAPQVLRLARKIWDARADFAFPIRALPPLEALQAADAEAGEKPFFVSDSADNVTAGSTGDNALMLKLALEAGIGGALFAAIIDPAAVETCFAHRPGERFSLSVGGFWDVKSQKVALDAELVSLHPESPPYCRAALVRHQGIDALLFDTRRPVFTEDDLVHFGVLARDYRVIVVKQGYLCPEFEAIAGGFIMALTPGNCAQDLFLLNYQNRRRPIFPFEPVKNPFDGEIG